MRALVRSSLACAAAAGLVLLAVVPPAASTAQAPRGTSCTNGEHLVHATSLADFAAGTRLTCTSKSSPETRQDVLAANLAEQVRHQGQYPVSSEAYASAVTQSQALAASTGFSTGAWSAVGKGPLLGDNPKYGEVNGEGFHNLSGRIQSFDYERAKPTHWIAGVANGGVFESTNSGGSWHSIGETLPTQIVGAVAFVGSTILVGTGDPAFGGSSYAGLGSYYSTNRGATWVRASGIPNGVLTFRVAVDPTNSARVYQATSKGLWRSTNSGRSYTNVVLPTTCTSTTSAICFFANIVTDVVVKAKNTAGGKSDAGGEVLAAVGWRAGEKLNAAGKKQGPRDGLYTSTTGAPGTFSYLTPTAFGGSTHFGRTALGIATGPLQDHDYVYAVVEDPQRFNGESGDLGLPPLPDPTGLVNTVLNPTVLNGIYGSNDFGKTWVLLESADELCNPTTAHSALNGTECVLGYAPGVQSWYNEWIQPDPSSQDANGRPTFLSFGLEEVWGGSAALSPLGSSVLPDLGVSLTELGTGSQFSVFGRYFSGTTCLALNLPTQGLCPTTIDPQQGTVVQGASTHPDQHAVMYVPGTAAGKATLVVGNDGGAYKQVGNGTTSYPYSNDRWGNGINFGFDTLLPYDAQMAKDGVVWGGLQDNGELKIEKDGTQNETFGGDGFFSAVDPDNSNVAYEEYTGGDISLTTDGGVSWTDVAPGYASALFSAPFMMDPTNARHLIAGGTDIEDTVNGGSTSISWKPVYALGSYQGYANKASAVEVRGASAYAGFCGSCDIVTQGLPFHSGLATNVGGSAPAKAGSASGWHTARAIGLPQRIINGVTFDQKDPKTVFVLLGGYGRRWIPPGSLADDISKVGEGHVFVSHDAGEHFVDVSGNLPDIAANHAVVHDGDLIIATDLGVYATKAAAKLGTSAATKGSKVSYADLAKGLQKVPVFHLQISPRNKNEIVAATQGRGVQHVLIANGSAASGGKATSPGPKNGGLAATGLSWGIPALALVLLGIGFVVRRRTRAA